MNPAPLDPAPADTPSEVRLARLEAHAEHTRDDLRELRIDVRDLRGEVRSLASELRSGIGAVRDELRSEIGAVRDELRSEIGAVRDELRSEIGAVREALRSEIVGLRVEGQANWRELSDRVDRHLVWLLGAMGGLGALLLGTMAKGFHWI